jgi:hypothetical protein
MFFNCLSNWLPTKCILSLLSLRVHAHSAVWSHLVSVSHSMNGVRIVMAWRIPGSYPYSWRFSSNLTKIKDTCAHAHTHTHTHTHNMQGKWISSSIFSSTFFSVTWIRESWPSGSSGKSSCLVCVRPWVQIPVPKPPPHGLQKVWQEIRTSRKSLNWLQLLYYYCNFMRIYNH